MSARRPPTRDPEATEARPVRRRTVALADGQLRVDHLVPCRASGGSSPLAECATCARRVVMPEDPDAPGASVVCRAVKGAPAPAALAAATERRVPADVVELALRTPVGSVVPRDVLAVREDVTVAVARSIARGAVVVVVDEGSRPVGLVRVAALVEPHVDPESAVSTLAVPFAGEVHDETALVHAIAGLVDEAGEGVCLPVVNDDGALVALLSPVDVVRWLASRAGYVTP